MDSYGRCTWGTTSYFTHILHEEAQKLLKYMLYPVTAVLLYKVNTIIAYGDGFLNQRGWKEFNLFNFFRRWDSNLFSFRFNILIVT